MLGGAWAGHLVLAHGADLLVVAAGTGPAEGDTVTRTPLDGLDPGLGLAAFRLSAAPVTVISGAAAPAIAIARTLACAHAAGGARATVEMATGYAKVREQFGRTIGSFQAVKHLLADMLADSELATAAAWDAARAAPDRACRRSCPPPSPPRSRWRGSSATRSGASRCTAASGSPGSTTRTCTCGGR